jgi:hypothetical protein
MVRPTHEADDRRLTVTLYLRDLTDEWEGKDWEITVGDVSYHDKGMMLQEAIQDFNKFLDLPPQSNPNLAIWDPAFSILAVSVPAHRLLPFLAKMEKAAQIEMAGAKAFKLTASLTWPRG